jgi:hypothetical protein
MTMSHSISALLTRNLHKGVYRGRDEIDRIAGAIRATHPDFDISQLLRLKKWAMAGAPMGIGPPWRCAIVRWD